MILHQAIDSVTGAKHTWTAPAFDRGAGYPGPNSPTNLLVLAGLADGAAAVLHQAIDSVTGDKYHWTEASFDGGAGYTGPNSPTNLLVLAGLPSNSSAVLHQAIDSVTGDKYHWTASAFDSGAGYPGPNAPTNVVVLTHRVPIATKAIAYVCLDDGGIFPLKYDSGTWTPGTEVATGGSLCFSADFAPDGASGLASFRVEGIRPFSVDPTTGEPTFGSAVASNTGPTVVRIASDGARALVAHWENNSVADFRLSGSTWSKHATITTLYQQYGLAIAPDGLTALVPSYASSEVSQLIWSGSAWTAGTPITLSMSGLRGVTIAPNGLTALVSHGTGVSVLTCAGGVWSHGYDLIFGSNAFNAAIAPDGLTAIVVCEASTIVSILSFSGGVWSNSYDLHDTGLLPASNVSDVAITPDGKSAIITALNYNHVYQLAFSAGLWAPAALIATPGSSSGTRIAGVLG